MRVVARREPWSLETRGHFDMLIGICREFSFEPDTTDLHYTLGDCPKLRAGSGAAHLGYQLSNSLSMKYKSDTDKDSTLFFARGGKRLACG